MNSILDRISKKLTAMGLSVGTGFATIQQGIADASLPNSIRATMIVTGGIMVVGAVAIYVMTQGNIDELKEEAKKTGQDVVDTVLKEG